MTENNAFDALPFDFDTANDDSESFFENRQAFSDYWASDMIVAIEAGYFDHMLKDMAKAIFNRRDLMDPQWKDRAVAATKAALTVKVGKAQPAFKTPAQSAEEDLLSEPSIARGSSKKASVVSQAKAQAKAASNAFAPTYTGTITPLPSGTVFDSKVHFAFPGNGATYAKAGLTGQIMLVPDDYTDTAIRGLRVKIKGLGARAVLVEFIDLPPVGHGMRAKIEKQPKAEPTFLQYSLLNHICK